MAPLTFNVLALLVPASYTATKHAVVGLSKCLRVDAERHGAKVSILCPGAVRTPILTGGKYGRLPVNANEAEVMKKIWEPLRPMAPDAFAERALRAVLEGDAIIVLPNKIKAAWYLERLSPSLSMRAGRGMLRLTRQTGPPPECGPPRTGNHWSEQV